MILISWWARQREREEINMKKTILMKMTLATVVPEKMTMKAIRNRRRK